MLLSKIMNHWEGRCRQSLGQWGLGALLKDPKVKSVCPPQDLNQRPSDDRCGILTLYAVPSPTWGSQDSVTDRAQQPFQLGGSDPSEICCWPFAHLACANWERQTDHKGAGEHDGGGVDQSEQRRPCGTVGLLTTWPRQTVLALRSQVMWHVGLGATWRLSAPVSERRQRCTCLGVVTVYSTALQLTLSETRTRFLSRPSNLMPLGDSVYLILLFLVCMFSCYLISIFA